MTEKQPLSIKTYADFYLKPHGRRVRDEILRKAPDKIGLAVLGAASKVDLCSRPIAAVSAVSDNELTDKPGKNCSLHQLRGAVFFYQ